MTNFFIQGILHHRHKKYDEALGFYERVLKYRQVENGEKHEKVLELKYYIAMIFRETKKPKKALNYFKEIYEERVLQLGERLVFIHLTSYIRM